MKKGQTESYSFLIGIVITVLILVGVGCAAYQIYRPKGQESYERFVNTLRDLEKKEQNGEGSIPIYVEPDEAIIGFNKGQEAIEQSKLRKILLDEGLCYHTVFNTKWWASLLGWEGGIGRPEKCPLYESCLCICRLSETTDIKGLFEGNILQPWKAFESVNYITPDACKGVNVQCKTFTSLELVGGEGCPYGVFIPGKKDGKERGLATVYYNKQNGVVSIDDEEPLTKEELKVIVGEEEK